MTTNLKNIILIMLLSLTIITVGVVVVSGSDKTIDPDKMGTAVLSLDRSNVDLGSMRQDEERSTVFHLENTSQKPLRIWQVTTSCSCTFAKIKIGDSEKGEFNMHEGAGLKNWVGEIPPGQVATISAIYRPAVMPVLGLITRSIIFSTNDPNHKEVELNISANVL